MRQEELYDVIRAPLVTEKSTMASENSQVVFKVAMSATKPEIKEAVERLFNVKVLAVNTLIRRAKPSGSKACAGTRAISRRRSLPSPRARRSTSRQGCKADSVRRIRHGIENI